MRVDEEEKGAIPGLCQMRRSLAGKKEAGERDMKLVEEDAGRGASWLPPERRELLSLSLSQSIYVDWFAHISLPLFFLTLRAKFPSL
jgi:hypothetical protein